MLTERSNRPDEHGEVNYNCSKCKDKEFIFYRDEHGDDYAKFCECRERNAWKRRFKQSMIPDEFTNANFDNYQINNDYQRLMYDMTVDYLKNYSIQENEDGERKELAQFNFGLIASFGEQRIKELPPGERTSIKHKHNNFGIGKTHLQMALAKRLIKDGFSVLTISDTVFMDDLMQARKADDHGESLNKLLDSAIKADVLVWDDIGKVNWTEPRERMYYMIINERYRRKKPIVFNSNEDRGTLAEKIGYAAASRLIGGCEDYLLDVEGEDWRLKRSGEKKYVPNL